jgi:NADH-quinone oxidoreductase subunit L
MFLALGVGAWSAAVFHFMIHAFFKALLFLGAGVVILLLNQEHDMSKMGGLWKKLPVVFVTFLIGSASLSALPLVTAGFYSKDQILWFTWSASNGSTWLWLAGLTGAFITSVYTFRMIFITFFGEMKIQPSRKPGLLMIVPLVVLAFLSLVGGFIELPENMGHLNLFSRLINSVLPPVELNQKVNSELLFQVLAAIVSLTGIYLAFRLYLKKSSLSHSFDHSGTADFFYKGWGFDRIYDRIFVRPVVWLSEIDKNDFIDAFYTGIARATGYLHHIFSRTQSGKLRWYVMALAIGIALILTFMFYL